MRIMAVGAHPDDVELGAGGTLHKHSLAGDSCCILDLTEGEMGTRGTPEIRNMEASEAARILGLDKRIILNMPDGFLKNTDENVLAVVKEIREYKPHILLTPSKVERHPDHEAAYRICKRAFFVSGLQKYPISTEPWRPKLMMSYVQERWAEPDLIVDVSDDFETKMEAIKAHKSQFYQEGSDEPATLISTEQYFQGIIARARTLGGRIGSEFAEAFMTEDAPGLNSFSDLFKRDLS